MLKKSSIISYIWPVDKIFILLKWAVFEGWLTCHMFPTQTNNYYQPI